MLIRTYVFQLYLFCVYTTACSVGTEVTQTTLDISCSEQRKQAAPHHTYAELAFFGSNSCLVVSQLAANHPQQQLHLKHRSSSS
jgi:hypothetical protein